MMTTAETPKSPLLFAASLSRNKPEEFTMKGNALAHEIHTGLHRKDDNGNTEQPNAAEITKQLQRISEEAKKAYDGALKEAKTAGELSVATKASVDSLLSVTNDLRGRLESIEQKAARLGGAANEAEFLTPGSILAKSELLAPFSKSGARTGQSVVVALKSRVLRQLDAMLQAKAAFSSSFTQAGDGVVSVQQLPGILERLRQRLFIRDLIAGGETDSAAIWYVRQTGFTNNADVVSEGVKKPESSITFDTKMAQVATIAHFFKASKQILDDFKGLQSLVDAELRYGLKAAEEEQILLGDGTGINLLGIIPQATAYSAAFIPPHHQRIDVLRLAILQSELAMLPATGIVVHPTDWAHIELTKTTDGAYLFANPQSRAEASLWGLPVVPTMGMTAGDFLVGAFRDGAQIFDREDANVVVATQNEDDFVKNMVTIRAEERLALIVKRPEAFITGTFPEDSE